MSSPGQIVVSVDNAYTFEDEDWSSTIGGSRTSETIPGGTLASGTNNIKVMVLAENASTNLGADTTLGSYCLVGFYGQSDQFNTE